MENMLLNYISQKLINSTNNVLDNLEPKYKDQLNTIITNIMSIMSNYFGKIDFNPAIKYTITSESSCKVSYMGVIDNSAFIKKQLNWKKVFKLLFNSYEINVTIYHDERCNPETLKENIQKIMRRLYNLFSLYQNKKSDKLYNILNYEYIFYLYYNPRRVNQTMSGPEYLASINESQYKCFNTASGVTEHRNEIIRISRIEDCLGLLTHEVLHGCSLIYIDTDTPILYIHGIKVNFHEAFVNMFAAIVNVYLTCFELKIDKIREFLLIELIHSINHTVKYCIIQGIDTNKIFINSSQKKIRLHQDVYLYEYIVAKMLLFLNFEHMIKNNKSFGDKLLSLTKSWLPQLDYNDYIASIYIEYNKKYLDLIQRIDAIHRQYLQKNKEPKSIHGNMIMSYHAIDIMTIEPENEIKELYGGMHQSNDNIDYKYKYLKYYNKYIKLKNKN